MFIIKNHSELAKFKLLIDLWKTGKEKKWTSLWKVSIEIYDQNENKSTKDLVTDV